MARRSSSLGPFPKTHRWEDIVAAAEGHPDSDLADRLIADVRKRLEKLADDDEILSAITFFVALPIVTREPEPILELDEWFGIRFQNALPTTLASMLAPNNLAAQTAMATLEKIETSGRFRQDHLEGTD